MLNSMPVKEPVTTEKQKESIQVEPVYQEPDAGYKTSQILPIQV